MQAQDTITVTVPLTLTLPRTITDTTDPQTVDYATRAYYRAARSWSASTLDGIFPFATLQMLATALVERTPVTVLYQHDGETTARTLFIRAIALTKDHRITVCAYCTLRREIRSFRVDRLSGVHSVTHPNDAVAA